MRRPRAKDLNLPACQAKTQDAKPCRSRLVYPNGFCSRHGGERESPEIALQKLVGKWQAHETQRVECIRANTLASLRKFMETGK